MSGLTHLRISSFFLIYLFFSFHCFINNNIYFALANRRKQDERVQMTVYGHFIGQLFKVKAYKWSYMP